MNSLRNKVTLIGNLGDDPVIKEFDGGKKLAKVSIATHQSHTNAIGLKIKETQWFKLIAWDKTAEMMDQYLAKGTEIAVEGKLINNQDMYYVEVSDFLILGRR